MSNDMAAFFDRLAPGWDNSPSKYDTREMLTSMMGLSPNSVIADIGCGKGVMFEHLLKTDPARIIAVDISGEMIRLAKELFTDDRIEYINGDFLDAPFPVLDAAVFFNSYPHFLDKKSLAEKLANIIKKDGTLIITHSLSRKDINGAHKGESVSKLSVPLEGAEIEANRYQKQFTTESFVDNDEIYFIKMIRK
jgi:demethylmenaquinone methyltransferase/2-methoxy-6-polyprenyl-1,4-benzoquinol methylase